MELFSEETKDYIKITQQQVIYPKQNSFNNGLNYLFNKNKKERLEILALNICYLDQSTNPNKQGIAKYQAYLRQQFNNLKQVNNKIKIYYNLF